MGSEPYVPERIIDSLSRYVNHRVPTGDFLRAVLENNLVESLGRADHENIQCMLGIVSYIYNHIPGTCWGSPKAVKEWLEQQHDH